LNRLPVSAHQSRDKDNPDSRERQLKMSNVITLTESNYQDEVVESGIPVLVDYWAPWCGPCRVVSPVVEEIAAEHGGAIKVGKVNVDDQPELASRAEVFSIPTLILYRDGEPAARTAGAQPKAALEVSLGLGTTAQSA